MFAKGPKLILGDCGVNTIEGESSLAPSKALFSRIYKALSQGNHAQLGHGASLNLGENRPFGRMNGHGNPG